MRKKRSPVWEHFAQLDNKQAKCLYCSTILVVQVGSSSNLSRHMHRKHPTIPIVLERQITPTTSTTTAASAAPFALGTSPDSVSQSQIQIPPPLPPRNQLISDYLVSKKPLSVRRSQDLDRQLVKMISKEYFPFSTVEDPEFQKFVEMLNASYKLPTRKTLANSLLPKYYEEIRTHVEMEVAGADAVCVTTDGWTSSNNESFIAVTAHFIDSTTKIKSYMLDCVEYRQSHTATNLAEF